jgi:hypothetical protein
LSRAPQLSGAPIRVTWRPDLRNWRGKLRSGPGPGQPVHAAAFLRERRIVLDSELPRKPKDLSRILIHELFHFAWLRLSNEKRRSWENLLAAERAAGARGELGWSAQWRKDLLTAPDLKNRSRRWREYACESFCDTAAWLYSSAKSHQEFSLAPRFSSRRRTWFRNLQGHPTGEFRI